MAERRFIKTVSFAVRELQLTQFAEWAQAARAFYASVGEGLLSWQVLRERTGARGYLEVFTFTDRKAYQALMDSDAFKTKSDELLLQQGQSIDVDSLEIQFHDELVAHGAQ